MTSMLLHILGFSLLLFHVRRTADAQPGFISIDCGGTGSEYTDEAGITWVPDTRYVFDGSVANITSNSSRPLQTLRFFSNGQDKNCYSVGPVNVSSRYLLRATFLYGGYDGASAFPSFGLSVDSSPWATVTIIEAENVYFEEFIGVADAEEFVVCLYKGTTGVPFISSLELRSLSAGMYSQTYLGGFFLRHTARINFGAETAEAVRYPDDPSDRIWVSDQVFPLQMEAPGTVPINTTQAVDIQGTDDLPPMRVMQSALIGTEGTLSYRLNLAAAGYPSQAYAVIYFAEIQNLLPEQTRAFYFETNIPDQSFRSALLNLENDYGSYTAFESGYDNASLPSLTTFTLRQDNVTSTLGPIMNALEIYQILPIFAGTSSADVAALNVLKVQLPPGAVVGDPCLPRPWSIVKCNSEVPPRVSTINLSGRNLTGSIPVGLGGMTGLEELRLDNNELTGSIPDLSQLSKLRILHLQNNQLSGQFPSSLATISTIREIFVENNSLSGTVPESLLSNGGVLIRADGNPDLCATLSCAGSSDTDINLAALIGGVVGGVVVLAAIILAFFLWRKFGSKKKDDRRASSLQLPFHQQTPSFAFESSEENPVHPSDGARLFRLQELSDATESFSTEIGSGGFGPVYYGKLKDGEEVAVKVLSASSNQGAREFFNEVNLLSRVHHRNLVVLFGYCLDLKERMLVYEYMHKGSLRDHLYGPLSKDEPLDWLRRLNVALDASKGLEYLHTGCSPSIIHRDVKSSNILINEGSMAKVADFGLSKLTSEGVTAVSTTVRGTVGYLDPEYYVSQQLTTKSDVFSFGVVLLELISGREPILVNQRSHPDSNIVNWARGLLHKGNVQGMVDPYLGSNYRMESLWKLVELALSSVEPYGKNRPTMGQIVIEITQIIRMETPNAFATEVNMDDSFGTLSTTRSHSPSASYGYDLSSSEIPPSGMLTESLDEPTVR